MQISVYRSQNGGRWGVFYPRRTPFCERYTLICMGLPPEALIWKVVNSCKFSIFFASYSKHLFFIH